MTYPGWILDPPTPLKKTARRLLCRVWELQQNTGWCYAHQSTLAVDLGVSERTIIRAVNDLRAEGYIVVELMPIYTTNGWKTPNRENHMRTTSPEEVLAPDKDEISILKRRLARLEKEAEHGLAAKTLDVRLHADVGATQEDVRRGSPARSDEPVDPRSSVPSDPNWAGPDGDFDYGG